MYVDMIHYIIPKITYTGCKFIDFKEEEIK